MSELKQEVLDLSQTIAKGLTLDTKNNTVTAAEGLYESILPEGITMDYLERVQAHNTDVIAATQLAVGRIAIPAMHKHADLNKVTLSLPTVGKDTFDFAFDRSRQVRDGAPTDKDAGMKTKYGASTVSVDIYGAGSRGSLAAVKALLSVEATETLGGKAAAKKAA